MDNKIENITIDDNTPMYSIGVVAELLNVSVQVLRLYEKEFLIIPFKKGSNHRLYTRNDITRLQCIRDSIKNKKFSISAIKAMYSLIPCWAIKNCSAKDRKNCEAYNNHLQPCWTYKHQNNLCSIENCNQCKVYTEHFRCESIKNTLKEKLI